MSSRTAPDAVTTPPRGWWSRRRLAFGLGLPVVVLAALLLAPARLPAGPAGWVLLGVTAVAATGTLASYVPETGRRPEVGCSPCAAMSALTVLVAAMLVHGSGPDLTGLALAAAVSIFGLGQRLARPRTCASPGGR